MGVPLLSGRDHARKKTGKKSSPLVSIRSLSISSIPLFLFFFGPSFRTLFSFAVHAITFACSSAERASISEIFHVIPIRQTNP